MVAKKAVKCKKCKKPIFYLSDSYSMSIDIECIECGDNKKPKKRTRRTASANFAKVKKGPRLDVHPTYSFRSPTEANFARILEYLGAKWKFEERAFTFDNYKNKPHIYIMDFEIISKKKLPDGLKSGWVEVKGWMRPSDRSKLRRLKKHYPEDAAKTTVVIYTHYRKKDIEFCKKLGYNYVFYDVLREKYEPLIPTWE